MTLRISLNYALALYNAFINNYSEGKVSDEGLTRMKDIFFKVDDEDKAFVFSVFLQFLKDADISYDVEQFQSA